MTVADLEISTDQSRLDMALIHRHLNDSYWAAGRSREVVERSFRHSLGFGVYRAGQQIAFARVISDLAVFAYVADVFVVPECRGQGIGKALVGAILDHPSLQGLTLVMLRTKDAHGLYTQFGFSPLPRPEEMMVLSRSWATHPDRLAPEG